MFLLPFQTSLPFTNSLSICDYVHVLACREQKASDLTPYVLIDTSCCVRVVNLNLASRKLPVTPSAKTRRQPRCFYFHITRRRCLFKQTQLVAIYKRTKNKPETHHQPPHVIMGRSDKILTGASPDAIASFAGHEPALAVPGQVNKKLNKKKPVETTKLESVHRPEKKRFSIVLDGEEAYLEYKEVNGALDLFKTYTPKALRGKGTAAILAKDAFEFASKNNKKIIPSCTYIRDNFLGTNQQYSKLVLNQSKL
ncbi:acetyltransferase [Planoprotostelium fungivorum]|uniref:Acetyltransferase n=1 Tax=Planoprotostelium fungivorum TaxID=1890364 RepID=A0A2P6NZL8_9EUKA|nr:acetyltransferase [Planoprotostelium fungivorum]